MARAAETPTFQPEVLLMKSAHDGGEQWFEHAKMKPAVTAGRTLTAVFRYRADVDVVTCTLKATPPDAKGAVILTVTIQRTGTDPAGNEVNSTVTQGHKFMPGQSLIVSTNPRLLPDGHSRNVEILQLTLNK
jgi:hypothetical protein